MASINNMNTIYADKIYLSSSTGVNEISDQFATIDYVNTNSGGISQSALDDSLAPLISKDVGFNNTLTSHIATISTHTTDIASNTASISTLNTKNLDKFNAIGAVNTNLATNYQTNSQLSANFYNKSETDSKIDNLA